VLTGILLGAGLLLLATLIEAHFRFGGDLVAAQLGSPLLWLIDTAPVVVTFLAWMVGRRQDQLVEVEAARGAAAIGTAEELSSAARELFQSVSAFSAVTAQSAASVQETTRTMSALSKTAMRAALTAETVVGLAQKSTRSSEEGLRAVEQATGGMVKLAGDVGGWASRTEVLSGKMRDIFAVTAVMGEIADRSQMLAAEAGAESERAGEAGKGFGRIAGQIREHAADARRAAAEVRTLLVEVEQALAAALAAMEGGRQEARATATTAAATGDAIRKLSTSLRETSQAAREIASVAQQQDRGIEEVLKAMNGIFLSVQEAVAQTGRVGAQARALSDLAASLKAQVQARVPR
jgi:methyl-accepting chemotaxis protein